MVSLRGFGRSVNSAHRTLGFGVLILLVSIAGCSSTTSADRQRLRTLQDDSMASYEPPTGELIREFEKAGRRYYVFFHAEWDESSSAVTRRWTIEADVTSGTDDAIDALEDNGWTLVGEYRYQISSHLSAYKTFDDFCGSVHVTVSDERRELRIEMAAPNSRSEQPAWGWENCLGLDPEDRENLATLESDPIASYEPPTGELLHYARRARKAHLGIGNVKKSWKIVADQEQALADVSDALRASGWTLTEENQYEQATQVKAHKLIDDFCALAYIDVTEGLVKLELTPAATLSQCETSR